MESRYLLFRSAYIIDWIGSAWNKRTEIGQECNSLIVQDIGVTAPEYKDNCRYVADKVRYHGHGNSYGGFNLL